MYIPKQFSVAEHSEILFFLRQNAFGQFISMVDGRLFSTHMPFLLSDDGQTLYAHFAR